MEEPKTPAPEPEKTDDEQPGGETPDPKDDNPDDPPKPEAEDPNPKDENPARNQQAGGIHANRP